MRGANRCIFPTGPIFSTSTVTSTKTFSPCGTGPKGPRHHSRGGGEFDWEVTRETVAALGETDFVGGVSDGTSGLAAMDPEVRLAHWEESLDLPRFRLPLPRSRDYPFQRPPGGYGAINQARLKSRR